MVLPGEKAILSAHHVDVLQTGGMIVDYHGVLDLLESPHLYGKSIYLVLRNAKEAKVFYQVWKDHFPQEQIAGIYVADGKVTEEALINDINTKLPDVVFLSMASHIAVNCLGFSINSFQSCIVIRICLLSHL